MGGCPIHIWVPLMAALLPLTRGLRGWFRARLGGQRERPTYEVREMKRWAPITTAVSSAPASDDASQG